MQASCAFIIYISTRSLSLVCFLNICLFVVLFHSMCSPSLPSTITGRYHNHDNDVTTCISPHCYISLFSRSCHCQENQAPPFLMEQTLFFTPINNSPSVSHPNIPNIPNYRRNSAEISYNLSRSMCISSHLLLRILSLCNARGDDSQKHCFSTQVWTPEFVVWNIEFQYQVQSPIKNFTYSVAFAIQSF